MKGDVLPTKLRENIKIPLTLILMTQLHSDYKFVCLFRGKGSRSDRLTFQKVNINSGLKIPKGNFSLEQIFTKQKVRMLRGGSFDGSPNQHTQLLCICLRLVCCSDGQGLTGIGLRVKSVIFCIVCMQMVILIHVRFQSHLIFDTPSHCSSPGAHIKCFSP